MYEIQHFQKLSPFFKRKFKTTIMAVAFLQFRCPLELLLKPNTLICVCKKTWMDAILSELEALKVGKNREISRFS